MVLLKTNDLYIPTKLYVYQLQHAITIGCSYSL